MAASVVVMAGDHVDHTRPLGRARPPFLAAQHEALGLPLRYGRDTGWGGAGAGLSDSEGAENSTAGERGQVALAHGRIAETQNWPHAEAIVEANESGQREVNGTELAQSPKVFLVVEAEQATLFSGYLHAKQAAVAEVERHVGRDAASLVYQARMDTAAGVVAQPFGHRLAAVRRRRKRNLNQFMRHGPLLAARLLASTRSRPPPTAASASRENRARARPCRCGSAFVARAGRARRTTDASAAGSALIRVRSRAASGRHRAPAVAVQSSLAVQPQRRQRSSQSARDRWYCRLLTSNVRRFARGASRPAGQRPGRQIQDRRCHRADRRPCGARPRRG